MKSAIARIEREPKAEVSQTEHDFIDQSLASAWQSAREKYGNDTTVWNARARAAVSQRRLGYYESLDGFPALNAAQAVALPALTVTDGGTIACQTSQSYTQWVPMHDPDRAQSLLPIGESERLDKPSRTGTLALWGEGRLHPAPLSRAKVEALGVTCTKITF